MTTIVIRKLEIIQATSLWDLMPKSYYNYLKLTIQILNM